MQLADLYEDFTSVLRSSAHGQAVLSQPLLPQNSSSVAVADILGVVGETSIDEKMASPNHFYDQPYAFFHDLKLAFGRLVAQFPQNVPEYNEISSLFKFSADLLVREAERLGFASHKLSIKQDGDDLEGAEGPGGSGLAVAQVDAGDEYLAQISHGFQTISTEMQDWNGETYWVTAANGPMFMSMNNKAPMDPRDTAVAGSVHTVKLLPHNARAPESTLGFASPLNPRFPQPDAPPTDLLSRFVHPNGHATFSPLWLTGQDVYASFAPTSDSAGAVVGAEDAAGVWADKAIKHVVQSSRPENRPQLKTEEENAEDEDAEMHEDAEAGLDLDLPDTELDMPSEPESIPSLSSEDLEALLKWTPYNFVDDDEFSATENGREAERELVSKLLLELQDLQEERMAVYGTEAEVGDRERHVAFKASKLLAGLVEEASKDDVDLRLDSRLPVLMRNYAGALPAAQDAFMNGPQTPYAPQSMPPMSQRLQTIANLRTRPRPTARR